MDDIARLPARDRADVFAASAAAIQERIGVSPLILEKDFWVCWSLQKLFMMEGIPGLLFKGGTSLSKGYSLIGRFSEDIDLVLDRRTFDVPDPREPDISSNERERRCDALRTTSETYIREEFFPRVTAVIGDALGASGWSAELDPVEKDCINFYYPSSLDAIDYGAENYIKPAIRLEMGIRGEHTPAELRDIQPYIGLAGIKGLKIGTARANVLHPRRTFWEKALIHHRQVHKPPTSYHRHSRHAYDLSKLAASWVGPEALADLDLLAEVVDHERVMFRRAKQDVYAAAVPKTWRLVSDNVAELEKLRQDYKDMAPMFFQEPPPFDAIVEELRVLQRQINSLP